LLLISPLAQALLLALCGESEDTCIELVEYVKINNKAYAYRMKASKEQGR
jgi:hypothetical protein